MAVDDTGHAYVAGYTNSVDFQTTQDAADPTFNGDFDAFVCKFNTDGSLLEYATLLGGS